MTEIISVRFKSGGKEYYFNPNGLQVAEGQSVIIETSKGIECATCSQPNTMIDEQQLISPLRPVLRLATEEDIRQMEENHKKEERAFQICQEKILEHGLEMKLIEVEYSFDGSKILFFFTADGRVDFRALVKDLASIFRTRIELRQIGVRDEAKMLGGLGICGRPFCCSSFLNDFHPVSIKMAKTQNLSLNPTKISGTCGRLMCCLKYEQNAYVDLLKRAPKQDSLVETPEGIGTVTQVNLLRETCKVVLDNDPENPRLFKNDELTILRSGKGKRPSGHEKPEDTEPKAEKTEKPERRLENVILPQPEEEQETEPVIAEPVVEAVEPEEELLSDAEVEAVLHESQPKADRPRRNRNRRPQKPNREGQNKEGKESHEGKENRESEENKGQKEPREPRKPRERREPKAHREPREPKENREPREGKEGAEGEQTNNRPRRPHYRKRRPGNGGKKPEGGAPKGE